MPCHAGEMAALRRGARDPDELARAEGHCPERSLDQKRMALLFEVKTGTPSSILFSGRRSPVAPSFSCSRHFSP